VVDLDCTLCRLVDGRLPGSRVHEDDRVVALLDHRPVNPGHVLVATRRHVPLLADAGEELATHVFRVGLRIAQALRISGVPCDAVNLWLADGPAAFQEIDHVHLHVVPRLAGDSLRVDADWRVRDRAELDASAALVRAGLAASAALPEPPRPRG
jgi:diadenosine tetraphosphate (Ap4A) HIT family hydrolase